MFASNRKNSLSLLPWLLMSSSRPKNKPLNVPSDSLASASVRQRNHIVLALVSGQCIISVIILILTARVTADVKFVLSAHFGSTFT